MTSSRFTEKVLDVLRSAGWREGRNIDVSSVESYLREKEVSMSSVASAFLREFHGLELIPPDGGLSFVKFNVHEELDFLEKGEFDRFRAIVNEELCPVGLGGRFLLFIAPSAQVFFLHDEWLLFLRTKNVPDAFEVICTRGFHDAQTVALMDKDKPIAFRNTVKIDFKM